jgi:hypothetical protein
MLKSRTAGSVLTRARNRRARGGFDEVAERGRMSRSPDEFEGLVRIPEG